MMTRPGVTGAVSIFCRRRPVARRVGAPPGGLAQRGAAIVEMALIAPVFLLLLIGVLEMSMLFYANLTMQYAVREGARYAVTGQNNLDPNATDQQRYQAIVAEIKDSSMGLYDKVAPVISVNKVSYGSASAYTPGMFGAPGDIMVIQLDCTWNLSTPLLSAFFKDGKYHFSVAATVRNEIYS